MKLIIEIILGITTFILLSFPISRWYKFSIYSISGKTVKGKITGSEKSKFSRSSNRKDKYYHHFHYTYYDKNNKIQKGRMYKLYHPDKFEVEDEVDVVYLDYKTEESIVPTIQEFFLEEMAIFIMGSIVFIKIFTYRL